MSVRYGRTFYKMTGSGNDFVFVDGRGGAASELERPDRIAALCARGTGVGADGVVFLDDSPEAALAIRYYNSDGSRASLCGNASLCTARLAVELGMAPAAGFAFATDAGLISARIREGLPEIDLQAVTGLRAELDIPRATGERRLGFAIAGVPHVVVLHDDVASADVLGRGRSLRWDPSLEQGANVNFVSPAGRHFVVRTFERGVEGETLACGTGAVATATLLRHWGLASAAEVELETRSGQPLVVRVDGGSDGARGPSLRGEGRLVYRGELAEV